MADVITTRVSTSGLIKIYTGTPPATVGTALSGNTLLGTLACSATFAAGASGGVLTASTVSNDVSADATGTAAFFRLFQSDGTTAIMQGTVGTSGADLNFNTVSFVSGGIVSITSFTITAPGA
tara:strand:+ start:2023 stop:2391 length:369 start_codon:yes stop_codon:yes gene_type:complete